MSNIIKQFSELKYKRKEVFEFLEDKEVREELVKAKKAMPKNFVCAKADASNVIMPEKFDLKQAGIELEEGEVFIVGNSVGFLDSHDDVSLKGSWTKTANEVGNRLAIVKDHKYIIDNLYAQNKGAMIVEMPIKALGYDQEGSTEVIGFKIKPYAELDYQKYLDGTISQHSMGLNYIKLVLCVDNPEFEEGYKMWETYKSQVINIEQVEELGYFWGVQEQKAIEVSSVVMASNPFTPAFANKSLSNEPPKGTQGEQPTKSIFTYF